ncbi:glycosyltransferase [Gimesia chilikensis]|uniref:glycosyltransferase n=1 Tax=Gimesia chilikensis TaxID=2605989 RepID=UPI001187FBCD|nr:glycosyltransferase [Gimesia chilikensis]QDT88111.1 Glycosyl transferase family 2 [Gimesia chilikensis]
MQQDAGILHALNQFRRFDNSEVAAAQFSERIFACNNCPRRSGQRCQTHGSNCADFAKPQSNSCPVWEGKAPPSVPVRPAPETQRPQRSERAKARRQQVQNLVVISCYFNPLSDPRVAKNAHRFRESINVPVQFCELSFDGEFLFDDSIKISCDESARFIWQKERLLNIAIEQLPETVDAVAVVDADLIFRNSNWFRDTLRRLQTADVVQCFDSVEYETETGSVEKSYPSFARSSKGRPGMPGGAVAFRRSILGKKGLHEENILGGGDSVMMRRWEKSGLKIDSVPGVVRHLYHGDHGDRQQVSRYEALKTAGFDFQKHIDSTPGKPLTWSAAAGVSEVMKVARHFFESRTGCKTEGDPEPGIQGQVTPKLIPTITANIEPKKQRETFSCDVILPYNLPNYHYLEDSIKSVLNQNFVETTIHLINDGMESDPIGWEYSRLSNVRLYKNADGPVGPYVTLNRLFDHLEHDYFANQDSDDISLPMRFYKSFQTIGHGYQIVGGAMEQFVTYDDDNRRMKNALSMKPYHYSGIVRFGSPSGNIVNSTALIGKSVYEHCNGMAPWKAGADSEFYERAILAGFKVAALSDVVALRRLHNPSLSNDQVTCGHGSDFREQIKQWTVESIERQKLGPDHSIGGLAKHRNDKALEVLKGK